MAANNSMMDLVKLIEDPTPGEGHEGALLIWVCEDCGALHYDRVPEKCENCEYDQFFPYVQGNTYVKLAKEFLKLAAQSEEASDAG